MISIDDLKALIQQAFDDAHIEIFDKTGMSDHYIVYIRSKEFEGKNPIARRQAVYAAVDEALKDGRLHAIEIQTALPEAAQS